MRIIIILFISTAFSGYFVDNFLKYSTAYASYSMTSPRYQEDRFSIVDGLGSGQLEVARTDRDLKANYQLAYGLRKIGRFKYEAKRGVRSAGKGGEWYDGSEQNPNESATLGSVTGWEYLLKYTKGMQWGEEYLNQEYWLRYTGNWFVAKAGYFEQGLEEVEYSHYDFRLKKSMLGIDFSVGVKHRQHPVYGVDAMVLDTAWYKGAWWDFAEIAFNWDDNMWFVEGATASEEAIASGEVAPFEDMQLYAYHPQTDELIVMDNGPFWQGNGEFWGYDWYWADEHGEVLAYTDREFFLYHFPPLLEDYIEGVKKDLGYQKETSLVLGLDFYHYARDWWVHGWANWLPYHYGHDKYSYHNAAHYKEHLEDNKEPNNFMFMDPMFMSWNDYDFGAILGYKLKSNIGVFTEGRYLFYWERPAYDFKFGLNYQFTN